MKSRWRLILGLLVSAVFLYWTLGGLKLDEFAAALRTADYWWLVPAVAVYFLGVWARTWRWHYMLRPIEDVPMYPLFRIMCIGYMGNNIFPARAGELLRSYVLKQEYGVRISTSIATVFIERLFDGLTMLLFVFVALPIVDLGSDALADYRGYIVMFTLLFVGALVVFLVLAARPDLARRIYVPVVNTVVPARWREQLLDFADRFLVGLESLRSGRDVALIFATSILVWLFETAKYWFIMHAFPFSVSFFVLMLMNGIVNLATTLPAAPGYVGTFDLPGVKVLMKAGVDREIATAYTLVLHVALWLPITLLGAFYLWRSHLSVQQMRAEMAEREVTAASLEAQS
ncbi:MAG: lysylphosphatidylglycerol synthase transmembrane domain-containing protein [Anaerolineae bacterium]